MTLFEIDTKEAWQLEQLSRSASDTRQMRRAQALLWCAEGDSVEEVADRLGVARRTIYNWIARYAQRADCEPAQRVADGARSGRPATALAIIDDLLEAVITDDPREHGYQSTIWTADLLRRYLRSAHQIEVCSKSVSLALQRVGIVWKRPRHVLALADPHWQQAKGG
jgi:transposase